MVVMVVNSKVGDLEEEIREVFSRRLKKDMNGVFQEVVEKRRYLVRFQDGLDKDILPNHITIVVVSSEVEKEI